MDLIVFQACQWQDKIQNLLALSMAKKKNKEPFLRGCIFWNILLWSVFLEIDLRQLLIPAFKAQKVYKQWDLLQMSYK